MNVSFLDHYSSMSGFKAKDKTTISEIAPQVSFTLDELDSENWKLLVFGDASVINQSASDALSLVVAAPIKGRTYDLSARSIAAKRLNHGAVTGTFAIAETVTGGTSAATAIVVQKVDTINELSLAARLLRLLLPLLRWLEFRAVSLLSLLLVLRTTRRMWTIRLMPTLVSC